MGPTRRQIRDLLKTEITPAGSAGEISAILKAGGYALTFQALAAGLAQVAWESVPPGARAEAAAVAPTQVVASGSLEFAAAGSGLLEMKLTPTGRRLLESQAASHLEVLEVTAKATFTPGDGTPPLAVIVKPLAPPAPTFPRCFGAASHDPLSTCVNPSLRLEVSPTPDDALITPNAPCTPNLVTPILIPCVFGAPLAPTTHEVALVGDSHAETWRAAMTVVANALGWSGVSLTRSSCAYSRATTILGPELTPQCTEWRAAVISWLQENPQVGTVFVSDNTLDRVAAAPGKGLFATELTGYLDAWRALPRSVRHIVVLRDTPLPGLATGPCVDAAIAHHDEAGTTCALTRATALGPDPAAAAAYADEPRASVIDLSDFFCGPAICPAVIGGVLVYKDASHMTDLFSTTLGPYLLARVRPLLAKWAGR